MACSFMARRSSPSFRSPKLRRQRFRADDPPGGTTGNGVIRCLRKIGRGADDHRAAAGRRLDQVLAAEGSSEPPISATSADA